MPIPNHCARVAVVGHLAGGEIFETGWWIDTVIDSETRANTVANGYATTFHSSGGDQWCAMLSADCGYDQVRVYGYPQGGPRAQYIGEANIPTGQGTSSAATMPLQVAMCLTTLTGLAGRRNRGRMYLPATTSDVMASGHLFSNSVVDNAVATAAVWITHAQDGHAVVLSQVAAGFHQVTAVRGDNRPDMQRRRANRQASTHRATVPV